MSEKPETLSLTPKILVVLLCVLILGKTYLLLIVRVNQEVDIKLIILNSFAYVSYLDPWYSFAVFSCSWSRVIIMGYI